MLGQKFNDDWKFWVEGNSFALIWGIDQNAQTVSVPHDAMIENKPYAESPNHGHSGFRDGAVYCYVKTFEVAEADRENNLVVKFEGIYMNASIYVNGALAAKSPFGYSNIFVDLNPHLKYGEENEIRIFARNGAMANSRWYSGGGIYRDVYWLSSSLTHIIPEGVQVTTESLEQDYAVLSVSTEINNKHYETKSLTLETSIFSPTGDNLLTEKLPLTVYSNETQVERQRISIDQPALWSEDSPELYVCESKLYAQDGQLLDSNVTSFGVRTIQVDTKQGLRINGKTVNLRGACVHHDSGLLGAATYEDAHYRQVKILKEAGFNAIRMSHQPMAPAMLRACDQLGMYVMDESFDMWTRCKSDYDYAMSFSEWWERDIESMVRKDFNHPSVILYSIGNEIPEIASPQGTETSHKIVEKIRSLDTTRFTLASINGVFAAGDKVDQITQDIASDLRNDGVDVGNVNNFMSLMDKHMDRIVVHPIITERLEKANTSTDIAGYNYMAARYEPDGEDYPNRVIVGSETYPPEISRNWPLVEKLPHVIGDFTWTGWDYIGEAGVGVPAYNFGEGGFGAQFPCQLAFCGDIDIVGKRRPASYFREIVYGLRSTPYITVQNPEKFGVPFAMKTPWVLSDQISSWTFTGYEDKPVILEIFSPGDEVEVLVNDISLGKKPAGGEAGFRTFFETVYAPGTVVAISYKDGLEIGREALQTANTERQLVIAPEDVSKKELIYVALEWQDSTGVVVTDETFSVDVTVEGAGTLIGLGTGDPKPTGLYTEATTQMYQGSCMAIIKKTDAAGSIQLSVKASNGQTATHTIAL